MKKIKCQKNEWTTIINSNFVGMPGVWSVVFKSPENQPIGGESIQYGSNWIFSGKKSNEPIKAAMSFYRKWINTFYYVKVKPDHDIIAEVPGIRDWF